jgi:phospholipase/carboxylesterase
VRAGAPLSDARTVAVVVHGRAQDPAYMREHLVDHLGAEDVAYLLPAAADGSWYPGRFHEPRAVNEPWLSWSLEAIEAAVSVARDAGFGEGRIVLAGFSQGGCLVADLLARRPAAYGGAAILTGALIGAPSELGPLPPLPGLPVRFATGRSDDWVPLPYVEATARAFAQAGADVRLEVLDEPEHRITPEAVAALRGLLERVG